MNSKFVGLWREEHESQTIEIQKCPLSVFRSILHDSDFHVNYVTLNLFFNFSRDDNCCIKYVVLTVNEHCGFVCCMFTPPLQGCGVLWSTGLSVRLCVCVSVCLSVREHISGTAGPIFTKFCMQVPCGRGSVLLWWRRAMLCTSGFIDDVTFSHNGRDAGKGWQHSTSAINYVRDRGEVWCLWMLV